MYEMDYRILMQIIIIELKNKYASGIKLILQSRVVETQARVGDLLDLEGCSGGVATALAQEGWL